MSEEAPAIGIDLGTTNSCAAVLMDDKIKLIHGEDGSNIMASFVFFKENGEHLVGNLAKENSYKNYKNGVFGFKRFIGRDYKEFQREKCLSTFPYIVKNDNNIPKIVIESNNITTYYNPEEISAMVLSKLKEQCEKVLGKKVTKAVITVPAHFNGTQRQATMDAGRIAGLDVLRIINEPTAAILAYEIDNKCESKPGNILVYDFGGGTFEVSIVTIYKSKIDVKATNGDLFLGGDDLNNNLVDHFIDYFQDKHNIDLRASPKARIRLLNQAEITKILLSTSTQRTAESELIDEKNSLDFECTITRNLFEKLNETVFQKTMQCVEKTLEEAQLNRQDIGEVLLVGGSTRIPYVQKIIKEYFGEKCKINMSLNPDEVVAIGAARQAALLTYGKHDNKMTLFKLSDVCNLSLGVEEGYGMTSFIVSRNTKIPVNKTEHYVAVGTYPQTLPMRISEGESSMFVENKLLAEFLFNGIRSAPRDDERGDTEFHITFDIDENGLLTALEKVTYSSQIVANNIKNNLSPEEIDYMIKRANLYKKRR